MQDKIKVIEVNNIKYPLVFNLNVMEKIQDKYETIEKWGELTDGKKSEVNVKALIFGIKEMINEGIDIENEAATDEQKREFLIEKQVGRLITEFGIQKITTEVQQTVIDSSRMDNQEKNV